MFGSKREHKSAPAPSVADTVISTAIRLEGTLRSTSNVVFDGEIVGDLTVEGELLIDQHGKVKGNVSARNIVVAGVIDGNITTQGRLDILATGRVTGDIVVGSLVIDEGGVFSGRSVATLEPVAPTEPAAPSVPASGTGKAQLALAQRASSAAEA